MFKYLAVALAATLSVNSANAANTIVDLSASSVNPNAGNNSSSTYPYNPVLVQLGAGTYSVGVVGLAGGGQYDGYSVYAPSASNLAYTDGNWSVSYVTGGQTQTQTQLSSTRFNTASEAATYYGGLSPLTFTLATAQKVAFFVDDTSYPYFGDDAGGVSLGIRSLTGAVPEPASWAMMIVGFGAVGGALRTSRRRAIPQIA